MLLLRAIGSTERKANPSRNIQIGRKEQEKRKEKLYMEEKARMVNKPR